MKTTSNCYYEQQKELLTFIFDTAYMENCMTLIATGIVKFKNHINLT